MHEMIDSVFMDFVLSSVEIHMFSAQNIISLINDKLNFISAALYRLLFVEFGKNF